MGDKQGVIPRAGGGHRKNDLAEAEAASITHWVVNSFPLSL
jgi:hypothetical protein